MQSLFNPSSQIWIFKVKQDKKQQNKIKCKDKLIASNKRLWLYVLVLNVYEKVNGLMNPHPNTIQNFKKIMIYTDVFNNKMYVLNSKINKQS